MSSSAFVFGALNGVLRDAQWSHHCGDGAVLGPLGRLMSQIV